MIDGSVLPESRQRLRSEPVAGRTMASQQLVLTVLIVLGVAVVTFVLYLYVLPNSQIDAAEIRISELQKQKAALERQNAALLQEIARNSDIKTLEVRAKQLGMAPARNAIYLKLPNASSAPASQPDGQLDAPVPQPVLETVRQWLQDGHLQDGYREVRINISQAVDNVLQRLQQQR